MTEGITLVANKDDVLGGRGSVVLFHPGNVRYRRIVREHQQEYASARKEEKVLVAMKVMDIIASNGARFLKRLPQLGSLSEEAAAFDDQEQGWVEVSQSDALDKVKQSLREKPKLSKREVSQSVKRKAEYPGQRETSARRSSPSNFDSLESTARSFLSSADSGAVAAPYSQRLDDTPSSYSEDTSLSPLIRNQEEEEPAQLFTAALGNARRRSNEQPTHGMGFTLPRPLIVPRPFYPLPGMVRAHVAQTVMVPQQMTLQQQPRLPPPPQPPSLPPPQQPPQPLYRQSSESLSQIQRRQQEIFERVMLRGPQGSDDNDFVEDDNDGGESH